MTRVHTSLKALGACVMTVAAFAAVAADSTRIRALPQVRLQHQVGAKVRPVANTTSPQSSFNRIIVKYRAGTSSAKDLAIQQRHLTGAATAAGLQGLKNSSRATGLAFSRIRQLANGAVSMRMSRALDRSEMDSLIRQLTADPDVAYAQPDYMKVALGPLPNDPRLLDLQWDLTDPSYGIDAPSAWSLSAGEGTIVAVLDTGYVPHQELTPNVVPGYDFVTMHGEVIDGMTYPDIAGDGDGRDADPKDPGDWLDGTEWYCGSKVAPSSWHGTHVAGTIAAVANNGVGIAGVAHGAKVQPVRVLGHCGGLTSDIADAIIWASGGQVAGVPNNPSPAEVINLSLGSPGTCTSDPATQDAINQALARGVVVVAAAGNSNLNASQFSPASCSGVITVGATGIEGSKAYYSNYGSAVTLSAPGGSATSGSDPDSAWIWSLGNLGTTTPVASPGGDVLMAQIGTSMAAPHVAAVAALMQSASVSAGHGAMSPELVKGVLRATVKPFGQLPPTQTPIGSGILNAGAAVSAAHAGVQPEDLAAPLTNRVASTIPGMNTGEYLLYRLSVPAGIRTMTLRIYGGSGDLNLLVGRNQSPTAQQNVGKSAKPGNTDTVVIASPAAGTYYLRVDAGAASEGASILATY